MLHPRSKMEPAVSKEAIGITSCVCQCCVMACHTPNFPEGDRATSWLPIKNRYSTRTRRLKVPEKILKNPKNLKYDNVAFFTYVSSSSSVWYTPKSDLAAVWYGDHFRCFCRTHFCIYSDPFYTAFYVGTGKNLLPSTGIFQPKIWERERKNVTLTRDFNKKK